MPTTSPNLGLTLPTPNVDSGWGSTLNTDFTLIDNLFPADGSGTSVGVQVGSGKTMVLGGTMILGAGDNTATVTAPTIRGAARTGTNAVGANLTIDAANGTGTGGSGNIIFRTAPVGTSGTVANTLRNALVIAPDGNVTFPAKSDPYSTNSYVTSYVSSALGPYATTTYVDNAVAGVQPPTTLYAIGTYVMGRPANNTNYTVNTTIAGSSLYATSATASWSTSGGWNSLAGQTLVNTGTWRCMSPAAAGVSSGAPGLWVRIS